MELLADLWDKGGVVMGVILMLSVYVVAVVLYKIYQFVKAQTFGTLEFDAVHQALSKGHYNKAEEALIGANPINRIIEKAIMVVREKSISQDDKIREVQSAAASQLRPFDAHLKGLEMVANIAPLLGLLGTVIGMVKAFSGLEQVGAQVDPSILAGGIWEALLTTVAGLAIAIPALAAHYAIEAHLEKIRATAEEQVSRILSLV